VTSGSRDLWIELTALGLGLLSLLAFVVAIYVIGHEIVADLLGTSLTVGTEPLSWREKLALRLTGLVPGISLAAIAWGLRVLLRDD
jgi:hypothetical protein